MKKLIKRLEELAIENEQLRNVVEEHVIDCFKEKLKDSIFEQMDDTEVVLDGIIGSFKDSGKVEERPKTTSTYEELGSQDFKKGDVLIREWLDGCVDYCRFKEFIKDNECLQNQFYDDGYYYSIYKNGKVDNLSDLENVAINCSYIETLKFNWRKATKEEIDKLNELLGKVEENKELEEAKEILKDWRFGKCNYSSDEIDRAIETILKHLEK